MKSIHQPRLTISCRTIVLTLAVFILIIKTLPGQVQSIYNPFRIEIDPMERLLLIALEKDPDTLYIGFEPQVFNDSLNGKGHLVIGWRSDGRVDVFHQPTLTLDPLKYRIAGKGLANMISREMKGAYFDVNNNGVQAFFEFTDIHGRNILLEIHESNTGRRKPFGLLAPMGSAAENPSALPLVLLNDFYFVRKKHTRIMVCIDGNSHKPDVFPIPLDFRRMYFTRYAHDMLVANINSEMNEEIFPFSAEKGADSIILQNCMIELEWIQNKAAIKSISSRVAKHTVLLRFLTSFPNISDLPNNSSTKGRFEIEGNPKTGIVSGVYTVSKMEDCIRIEMVPSDGWKPRPTKLSLRFLYTMVGTFKKWPATYKWTAIIQETSNHQHMIKSSWSRIK